MQQVWHTVCYQVRSGDAVENSRKTDAMTTDTWQLRVKERCRWHLSCAVTNNGETTFPYNFFIKYVQARRWWRPESDYVSLCKSAMSRLLVTKYSTPYSFATKSLVSFCKSTVSSLSWWTCKPVTWLSRSWFISGAQRCWKLTRNRCTDNWYPTRGV